MSGSTKRQCDRALDPDARARVQVLAPDQATAGAVAAGTTARPIVTVPETGV